MSHVSAGKSKRAHARRFTVVAALAIAIFGLSANGHPTAASPGAYYCAVGGNIENGGTAAVGCAFGGDAGAAIAGTIDVSDPGMTLAAGFGGDDGYPAVNVAGDIDLSEPSVQLAGGVGGYYPYPAYSGVIAYP